MAERHSLHSRGSRMPDEFCLRNSFIAATVFSFALFCEEFCTWEVRAAGSKLLELMHRGISFDCVFLGLDTKSLHRET